MLDHVATSIGNALPGSGGGGSVLGDVRLLEADPGAGWLAEDASTAYTAQIGDVTLYNTLTSFASVTSPFGSNAVDAVTYGNGLYVAVGAGGNIASSPDGDAWTIRATFTAMGNIRGVCFAAGMFVAVGNSGRVATSSDGLSWTQRTTSATTADFAGVTYGNGLFLAVAPSGGGVSSPDAITWTARSGALGNAVCFGKGLYVAVSASGAIRTSPDTITWTARTSPFGSAGINAVIFADGMFVAVGASGLIATSLNAIAWGLITSIFGGASINCIAYAAGMFIVNGFSTIYTSPDLVTATTGSGPFASLVYGIAYGPGRVVAVSTGGLIAAAAPATVRGLSAPKPFGKEASKAYTRIV